MITASEIPVGLSEQAALGPLWVDWLSRLPGAVSALLDEWGLRRDGDELWHGFESLVVPIGRVRGRSSRWRSTVTTKARKRHWDCNIGTVAERYACCAPIRVVAQSSSND